MSTACIEVRHHADRGSVTIELTESFIVGLYISGCAVLIGGLWIGCVIWQQGHRKEPCACAWCQGQYIQRRLIGSGGFGDASLVTRGSKTHVVKKIACDDVNAANQALLEAGCLQRLRHENVVRFDDLFLHKHLNRGCSVFIVMEYCAGGDLIDRIECQKGEAALSELQVTACFESLCLALHRVPCCVCQPPRQHAFAGDGLLRVPLPRAAPRALLRHPPSRPQVVQHLRHARRREG